MRQRRGNDSPEHTEIAELMPWYLNSTIGEGDRERLEAHLGTCAHCRADLEFERRVHQGVSAEAAVEYIPAASLKRLHVKLDAIDSSAPQLADRPSIGSVRTRSMPWPGLMAASVAALALALALVAADRWIQFRTRTSAPIYYTVTHSVPRAPGEAIRVVFAPTVTLMDLQRILDESQMRIIAGPSEAGVYSLASTSARPIGSSLTLLRNHPEVRFAESTETISSGPTSRAHNEP